MSPAFGRGTFSPDTLELGGLVVPVVALADLRAMKRAAGRPKDLDDLANLPTE